MDKVQSHKAVSGTVEIQFRLLGHKTRAFNPALGDVNRCARKENCCCFKLKKFGKSVN